MPSESDLVGDEEAILRRIPASPAYVDLDPGAEQAVSRLAFQPHKENDTDGLSVYRRLFLSPRAVAATREKPSFVAELLAARIRGLGLSVEPDPLVSGPPGHALIPELTAEMRKNDPERCKQLQLELALIASERIVHTPED